MATVSREDIIVSKKYRQFCDLSWKEGLTEPLPSGIISVPMEHMEEFIAVCGDTDNNYIVVSQRSDFGLCYQQQFPVWQDMVKWIHMIPFMDIFDFSTLGYSDLRIAPRCDVDKCNLRDNYSIKCDSFTRATIPFVPSNIKKWYMVNCMTEEPNLISIPFGLLDDKTADILNATPIGEKEKWLYVNFQTYTLERSHLKTQMGARSMSSDWITFVPEAKSVEEYFSDIAQHKYVLCPEGNGIDCFRTWESIYLGAIPVVKRSPTTEQFSDLPILIVDDMFNIRIEFLQEKYEETLLKRANLDKAKLSYWKNIFEGSKNESCN